MVRHSWFLLLLSACPAEPVMPAPDKPTPCPQTLESLCGTAQCGNRTNTCGQVVSCGSCGADKICNADKQCVAPTVCMPNMMTACAGRVCGARPDGCGGMVTCGTCAVGSCSAQGQCASNDGGVQALRCPTTRAMTDRPDDSALLQVRMMYVIPSDGLDEHLDTNGRICQSALAFTHWLGTQTGGPTLRLDTANNGELDIGFLKTSMTRAQLQGDSNEFDVDGGVAYVRERLELELRAAQLVPADKLLAVFYGGSSVYACGGAPYPPTIRGSVVAMYLKSTIGGVGCEARPWGQGALTMGYYDWAMLHDVMHALGIVPSGAPNFHLSGHSYDTSAAHPENDLMYTQRTGRSDADWGIDAPAGLVLDINHDDYYAHDAGFVDLRRSGFLQPLPVDAQRPPGW